MTVFELRGGPAPLGVAIGPWVAVAPSGRGPVSFAADGVDEPEMPCWRVELGGSAPGDARRHLERGERDLAVTERQLLIADARLSRAIGERSIDIDELVDELAGQAGAAGPQSFASGDDDRGGLVAGVEAALSGIARTVTSSGAVETHVAGALIARTEISWTGDLHTFVAPQHGAELMSLHRRSVLLSLRTKNAWRQLLVTVLQGTARLAGIATGAGAIMALPAVWSFVRKVLADVEHLRRVRGSM